MTEKRTRPPRPRDPNFDIAEIRSTLKISQAEMGRIIGVDQATICNWEKGRAGPDLLAIPAILRLIEAYRAGRNSQRNEAPQQPAAA